MVAYVKTVRANAWRTASICLALALTLLPMTSQAQNPERLAVEGKIALGAVSGRIAR